MSSATMNCFRLIRSNRVSTDIKLTISYLAAHLTAISTVGFFYMLGLFDVGFLSEKSLIIKFAKQIMATLT